MNELNYSPKKSIGVDCLTNETVQRDIGGIRHLWIEHGLKFF